MRARIFIKRKLWTRELKEISVEAVDYDKVPEFIRSELVRGGAPTIGSVSLDMPGEGKTEQWSYEYVEVEL